MSKPISDITALQASGVEELYRAIPYISGSKRRKHLGWFQSKEEAQAAIKEFRSRTINSHDYHALANDPKAWEKEAKQRLKDIIRKYEASK